MAYYKLLINLHLCVSMIHFWQMQRAFTYLHVHLDSYCFCEHLIEIVLQT